MWSWPAWCHVKAVKNHLEKVIREKSHPETVQLVSFFSARVVKNYIVNTIYLRPENRRIRWRNERDLFRKKQSRGTVRVLNPGPLAPKARIIPLDQLALCIFSFSCEGYLIRPSSFDRRNGFNVCISEHNLPQDFVDIREKDCLSRLC